MKSSNLQAALRPLSIRHRAPRPAWRGFRSILVGSLACCSLVSCRQAVNNDHVLAEVGGEAITASDLKAEAKRRADSHRPARSKEELLQEMVNHIAMLQRVRAAGIDQDPGIRRKVENVLLGALIERELTPRLEAIGVSASEVQDAYDRNRSRYTHPAQARLSLLTLEAGPKDSAARRSELRSRLEEARRQILEQPASTGRTRGVRSFGSLALECSDDPVSRHRGGDIGWIRNGQPHARYPAEVLAAAHALAVGEVSEVMETPGGFYLALKTDARDESVTPLEGVRAAIRHELLTAKRKEAEENFRRETLAAAAPRTHPEALARVELSANETLMARAPGDEPGASVPGGPGIPHGN